jgi:hypothetical protein
MTLSSQLEIRAGRASGASALADPDVVLRSSHHGSGPSSTGSDESAASSGRVGAPIERAFACVPPTTALRRTQSQRSKVR